ncbi:hypothetical protein BH11ACT5_BH11ACT5_06690 [soil metagenome]
MLLLIALVTLVNDVPPSRYLGIGAWLVGALILHDGVVAIGVVAVSVLVRKIDRRVPFAVILMVQGAVVVGAIVTVLVLPEIVKKSIGTANPSILPLNYLGNLGLFYAGLAVVTAIVVAAYLVISRARRTPPAAAQTE